jgi:FlaA1/EpsC-like NDP-sugar epimerase
MLKSLSIVPRAIIFLIDLSCSFFALLFSLIVFHSFNFTLVNYDYFLKVFWVVGITQIFSFFVFTTFSGIVRYTSTKDGVRILYSILTVFFCLLIYKKYLTEVSSNPYLDYNVFAIYSVILFLGLMSYRLIVKYIFSYLKNLRVTKKNVIIYGAASAGIAAKRALESDQSSNFTIVAFIDDNPKKIGKVFDGSKFILLIN